MPPRPIRILAALFLGLPGAGMWLGGLVVITTMIGAVASTETLKDPGEVAAYAGAALVASVVGSVMIKVWELFVRGNRHQLSFEKMAKMIPIALAGQILLLAALCLFVIGIMYFAVEQKWARGAANLGISVVAAGVSIYLHRLGFRLRAKWEAQRNAELREQRALEAEVPVSGSSIHP